MWIRKESAGKAQKRVFFTICTVIVGFLSNETRILINFCVGCATYSICDVFDMRCVVLICIYVFKCVKNLKIQIHV
jgi:hypothetical protein